MVQIHSLPPKNEHPCGALFFGVTGVLADHCQSGTKCFAPQEERKARILKNAQGFGALALWTRLLSRETTEPIRHGEGSRAAESNASIMVTNPSSPTTSSRTTYRSRRHFYILMNAAAHSLRRSSFSPQTQAFAGSPVTSYISLAALSSCLRILRIFVPCAFYPPTFDCVNNSHFTHNRPAHLLYFQLLTTNNYSLTTTRILRILPRVLFYPLSSILQLLTSSSVSALGSS